MKQVTWKNAHPHKLYDPYTAVFNSHVNEAHDRAIRQLQQHFPDFARKILRHYVKGIMGIFSQKMNPAISMYVALVTAYVNETAEHNEG